jgi:hypothetical protein
LQRLSDLAVGIYWLGCIVAAIILAIGVADYWFGHDELFAFFSWVGASYHSVGNWQRNSLNSDWSVVKSLSFLFLDP